MAYVVEKAGQHYGLATGQIAQPGRHPRWPGEGRSLNQTGGPPYAVIYEDTNPITGGERPRWHHCPTQVAAIW
jgi:hypothetical protein